MENARVDYKGGLNSRVAVPLIGVLGLLSVGIYALNFRLCQFLPQAWRQSSIHDYLILFAVLSVLYLAAVGLVLNCRPSAAQSRGLLLAIIALAVAFRLFQLFQEPTRLSSDMYRFIWDGRVQHHGFNPYRRPPGAEALKGLRDPRIYPHINRKSARTLYPAGAQLFFRAVYRAVGDSVTGFKSVMVACDISALAVLAALLKVHGRNPNRLLIYAWNPLVVFEIAYSGHLEGITVLLMLSAFYLAAKRKKTFATFFLALCSGIKIYPGLLLPALLKRGERIRGLTIFTAVFGLLYLPYLNAGEKMMGFLPVYLKNPYESFNLGFKYVILHFFPRLSYYWLSLLFIAGLLVAGTVVLFKEKAGDRSVYYGYVLTGWLMILMPAALHPWYVILIIPFLAFYPHAAWLIFSCAVSLSYLKYVSPQGIMPTGVLMWEYVPLLLLLGAGYLYGRTAGGRMAGRNCEPAGIGR